MRPAIQFSGRVTALILAVLWLCQTPIWAGIYKWKDDQGKVHFTDDKSRIPLKYRGQLEKFKGVTESKPKPVEAEEEEEAVAPEAEEKAANEKAVEEKAAEREKTAELVAALKETKSFLEHENASHERMVKFVKPTKFHGRNYVVEIRRRLKSKIKLAEKLSKFEDPVLIMANSYLAKSIKRDEREEMGGPGYLERILALNKRMKTQVETKKRIIRRIKSRLKKQNAK